MSQLVLANSYSEASKIVTRARVECVDVEVLWAKLNRINKYLQAQARIALLDTLN
jgi:hypothetical protein